ncbi:hypothetical protein F0562_029068 [Nyssa sinensis]|uniref:DNA-directed RNA polymerase n=1 Tax=Nyssa sinensis TaxID=561372 RepID=A0A5J5B213_9ASTE|nr:hypothetical protein F0562_029068 [Nyssa sinensis]
MLGRNCSISSTASHRFRFDKQSTLQTAVKRAFSMRRSSSVSQRYCMIHDQCVTVASPIDGDDETMQTRSLKKRHRTAKILKAFLPPELRPIIQIDGGKLMSSDINELYRRVIYRNNTLTDLLTTSRSTPGELVMCQEKLVQEAVDTLLDNGIRGQPMRDGHNKVYKSFSFVV